MKKDNKLHMASRQNYPKAVSPKGVAIYPRLNTPDDKFNKAGQYKVKLAIDGDDADLAKLRTKVDDPIAAKLKEVTDELKENGKAAVAKKITTKDPFQAEEDQETGEETGRILINAKMTASGTGKKGPWTRKPSIFDAKGKALSRPPIIGGGSELKLSLELFPYYAANDKTVGVSFRLEAVQVIKLVTGGQRDASGYGFGEEDGDEIDDVESGSDFTADSSSSSDDEDDEL